MNSPDMSTGGIFGGDSGDWEFDAFDLAGFIFDIAAASDGLMLIHLLGNCGRLRGYPSPYTKRSLRTITRSNIGRKIDSIQRGGEMFNPLDLGANLGAKAIPIGNAKRSDVVSA
jgi:hypothetical protein